MTSRLTETIVDCTDPGTMARFWAAALGYTILEESAERAEIGPAPISDHELLESIRSGPVAPAVAFERVPEPKASKNRLHLDLSPIDRDQASEI